MKQGAFFFAYFDAGKITVQTITMLADILNYLDALFSGEMLNKAGMLLGEPETDIRNAVKKVLLSLVDAGFAKTTIEGGAAGLMEKATNSYQAGILENPAGFLSGTDSTRMDQGRALAAEYLDGNRFAQLSASVSRATGIKAGSAASLTGMAVSLFLAAIGKYAAERQLDASTLAGIFESERMSLPESFKTGTLQDNKTGGTTNKIVINQTHVMKKVNWNVSSIIGYAILLAMLAVFAGYAFKSCYNSSYAEEHAVSEEPMNHENHEQHSAETKSSNTKGVLDTLSGDFNYDQGVIQNIELPGGAKISAGMNSTEYKLVQFLNDSTKKVDTLNGTWFEFTNVHFKKGGSELTDASAEQLKNMVAIANAYPSAKFKFGGYTDSTGTDGVNLPLSQKRAEAVQAMVIKLGAKPTSILGAKGYGKQWPIADNGTKEGQAMNRRVSVNVKAK